MVLRHVALQQLDYRLRADALAAVRSATFNESHARAAHSYHSAAKLTCAFLDEYARSRGDSTHPSPEWSACRDIAEAIDLVHLEEAVRHVTNDYCLSIASKMPQEQQSLNLSAIEEIRIKRAIYRFQTYCNLFVHNDILPEPEYSDLQHPANRYLPSFPPWEILEIACIWHYSLTRWASILREMSDSERKTEEQLDNGSDLYDTISDVGLSFNGKTDRDYGMSSPNSLQSCLRLV